MISYCVREKMKDVIPNSNHQTFNSSINYFFSMGSKLLFLLDSDGFTMTEKVNNFWKSTIGLV